MDTFSERQGLTPTKTIQISDMDQALRNSLWNVFRIYVFNGPRIPYEPDEVLEFARAIHIDFRKLPYDTAPDSRDNFYLLMTSFFQRDPWFEVYNFIEFIFLLMARRPDKRITLTTNLNFILERERSGYRVVADIITPITNETELSEIAKISSPSDPFSATSTHIRQSLKLYSDRENPDYRNSVKEAVSAIEATAKVIVGDPKATLGKALAKIEEDHQLHGAFKEGVSKLYGWTSDASGIRHALSDVDKIDEADARFMLVSCSAFCNYLISRSKT